MPAAGPKRPRTRPAMPTRWRQKLVTYFRLLSPGQAGADEIAAFMARQSRLAQPGACSSGGGRRRSQRTRTTVPCSAPCAQTPITLPARWHAAPAHWRDAGSTDAASADARAAWIAGYADPAGEAAFLSRWAAVLTPADNWARFQHFAWSDPAAAARQVPRLAPAMRAAAKARLALIQGAADATRAGPALPPAERDDPGLVLDRGTLAAPHASTMPTRCALWQDRGFAAEQSSAAHRAAFWAERNILARELLKDGDNEGAYAIADDTSATAPADIADAGFLAGFIALRRLHDPAARHPAVPPRCRRVHAQRSPRPARITGSVAPMRRRAAIRATQYEKRRRLPHHVLRPAWRRARAATRTRRRALAASRRPVIHPRSGLGLHRARTGARRRHAGGVGRAGARTRFPAAHERGGAGAVRTGAVRAAGARAGDAGHRRVHRPAYGAGRADAAHDGWPMAVEPPQGRSIPLSCSR